MSKAKEFSNLQLRKKEPKSLPHIMSKAKEFSSLQLRKKELKVSIVTSKAKDLGVKRCILSPLDFQNNEVLKSQKVLVEDDPVKHFMVQKDKFSVMEEVSLFFLTI